MVEMDRQLLHPVASLTDDPPIGADINRPVVDPVLSATRISADEFRRQIRSL